MTNVLKTDIPKWAIPTEEIPVYVEWNRDITWDQLLIKFPKDIHILEVSNVENFEVDFKTNICKIDKVFSAIDNSINFYIVALVTSSVTEAVQRQEKIEFLIYNKGVLLDQTFDHLRIFRPKLEIFTIPNTQIVIIDKGSKGKFPIGLKLFGFGDVRFKFDFITEGIVTTSLGNIKESLLRKFLKYLHDVGPTMNSKINSVDNSNDKIKKETSLELHPNLLEEIISEAKNILQADDINLDIDITESEWKQVIEPLNLIEDDLLSIFKNFLYDLLTDTKRKYPGETLENQTPIIAVENPDIFVNTKSLKIQAKYLDVLDNEYKSNVIEIPVMDERKNKKTFPDLKFQFNPDNLEMKQIEGVEKYEFK
ncbi:MAG: hypothetical protein HeimC3_43490 [Candidatus Heimdallarchaeota archaeon LC_3]|nr:MAG: hypothetical protein HeimC3_43490 [Candidatus Heimdallarchaeota archaeon LC_3]